MFNIFLENYKNIFIERDFVQKLIVDIGQMYKYCKIKIEM